jgi:hypothetical protein
MSPLVPRLAECFIVEPGWIPQARKKLLPPPGPDRLVECGVHRLLQAARTERLLSLFEKVVIDHDRGTSRHTTQSIPSVQADAYESAAELCYWANQACILWQFSRPRRERQQPRAA